MSFPWLLCLLLFAQAPPVPEWAQPGSPTHVQVPPPADFHRPSRNFDTPIGVFQGQSDVGGAVVPGSSSYDPSGWSYAQLQSQVRRHDAYELTGGDDLGFFPELREMPAISGDQVIGSSLVGAFQKYVVVRVDRHFQAV